MVGRIKPVSVLFATALAVASLASAASAQVRTPVPEPLPSGVGGVGGIVSLFDQPCPFAGCGLAATVIARQADRVVAWTEADRHGRYGMDLRPGKYELLAWPHIQRIFCSRAAVDVPPGKHVRVDFRCRWGVARAAAAAKD